MGIAGISPWSLLLILAIAIVVFGTKRIKNLGGDLGKAVKDFKQGIEGKSEE